MRRRTHNHQGGSSGSPWLIHYISNALDGGQKLDNQTIGTDFISEAVKGAPPVAVVASSLGGILDVNFLVALLTGLYVLLQGAYLIWKWRREAETKP